MYIRSSKAWKHAFHQIVLEQIKSQEKLTFKNQRMRKFILISLVGTMAVSCLENEDFYTPTEMNSIENPMIHQRFSYQNEINDSISIKDSIKENDEEDDPGVKYDNGNTKRENTNNHHFVIDDLENIQ